MGDVVGRTAGDYAELFGWKADSVPNDYFMMTADGDRPAGVSGPTPRAATVT